MLNIPFCKLIDSTPHVLIAGETGSGKSVLLDDYICYTMQHNTTYNTALYLIDPKRVSFVKYKNSPFVIDIFTETDEILFFLDFIIRVMDAEYIALAEKGKTKDDSFRYIIIIDEIADLIDTGGAQFVDKIKRIAQLGRACGIKLICATQHPQKNVISARLSNNFTGRIALTCSDSVQSRQIIGQSGAESLPAYGKALFKIGRECCAVDVPLLSDETISEIVETTSNNNKPVGFKSVKERFKEINAQNGKKADEKKTDCTEIIIVILYIILFCILGVKIFC